MKQDDGSLALTARDGDVTLGGHVHIEVQNAANADAIYTVPVNKTFTGTVVINGRTDAANGSLGVSAATGGTQASCASTASGAVIESASDVTIAGGGSGNALTALVSNAHGSIIVDGYVK